MPNAIEKRVFTRAGAKAPALASINIIQSIPQPYLDMPTQAEIFIYNTLGQLQLQKKVDAGINSIDVSHLSSGIYTLFIHTSSQRIHKKLCVK
jgi:hypothetical protein